MNIDVLVAIYGIIQADLRDGYLDAYGATQKGKNDSELTSDVKAVYEILRVNLKFLNQEEISKAGEKFNTIITAMAPEYSMNMFLLAILMLEGELSINGSNPQKIILMPKVKRIIKNLEQGITKQQDDGFDIIRDSRIGASNVLRRFRGLPEKTKAMREWRLNQFREAARKAQR